MLNSHTSALAHDVRRESATVAATARMPATRSPNAAGTAKAAGSDGETTPGTKKLSPMKRRNIWGTTNTKSARLRFIVCSRGQAYICAITPELTKLINVLIPNNARGFIGDLQNRRCIYLLLPLDAPKRC